MIANNESKPLRFNHAMKMAIFQRLKKQIKKKQRKREMRK